MLDDLTGEGSAKKGIYFLGVSHDIDENKG